MVEKQKVRYDSRKKTLFRTIVTEDDLLLENVRAGGYKIVNEQEYGESGIRLVMKELKRQKQNTQDVLTKVNETLESTKDVDMSEELELLESQLRKLNDFQNRKKALAQREQCLKDLQVVNGQIKEIKDAVGKHLRL